MRSWKPPPCCIKPPILMAPAESIAFSHKSAPSSTFKNFNREWPIVPTHFYSQRSGGILSLPTHGRMPSCPPCRREYRSFISASLPDLSFWVRTSISACQTPIGTFVPLNRQMSMDLLTRGCQPPEIKADSIFRLTWRPFSSSSQWRAIERLIIDFVNRYHRCR